MTSAIGYSAPGRLTDLGEVSAAVLEAVPADPVGICRLVPGLVLHPFDATDLGLDAGRLGEQEIRPASAIIGAVLALDPAALDIPREPGRRLVATCRTFVVLSCALLRHRGIAARARCGFGTYFRPGLGLDHWVTEYWHQAGERWVRVDTQHLEHSFVPYPEDLRPGEFLTGGEAWISYRHGGIDAATFGVPGTENFGPAEISGNTVRDLAALNKVEMLPWDEWGQMTAAYAGQAGPGYDELIDEVAAACAWDSPRRVADLYSRPELRVPAELIQ
ncbi:MAG: transglutaminase-like domain-containing protein [Actinomycetota bacterium]|nr:transglutaminase-like domain-containing protein [Actinomycetota bacterium]